jgi:hypothetical protein
LIVECTWYIFGTQIEDQEQAQDGDEVYVLVTIEDHMEEGKGLKPSRKKMT